MMMLKYSLSVFCFLLAGYSCVPGHKETKTSAKVETTCTDSIYTSPSQKNESASTLVPKHQKSPMALYMDSLGLINIAELDNSIAISLMYTKADNFTGEILYDNLSEAYLHPHAAYALLKAQEALKALHPSYSLIIYDAARPMSVQRKMWDVVKGTSKYRHQHSGLAGATVAYGHKGRSSWSRSAHHRRRRTDTQRKNHQNRTSEPDIIEESNESRRIPCIAQRMVAFQLLQPRRSPEEIQRNTINKSTI